MTAGGGRPYPLGDPLRAALHLRELHSQALDHGEALRAALDQSEASAWQRSEADARLADAAPALAEALRDLLGWIGRPGEAHTDLRARIDDWFYRETGLFAPGRDEPAAMGSDRREERRARWDAWTAAHGERVRAAAGDALSAAGVTP